MRTVAQLADVGRRRAGRRAAGGGDLLRPALGDRAGQGGRGLRLRRRHVRRRARAPHAERRVRHRRPARGLERLGGIDLDQLLDGARARPRRASATCSTPTVDEATLAALVELRDRCQAAKEALSVDPDARIAVERRRRVHRGAGDPRRVRPSWSGRGSSRRSRRCSGRSATPGCRPATSTGCCSSAARRASRSSPTPCGPRCTGPWPSTPTRRRRSARAPRCSWRRGPAEPPPAAAGGFAAPVLGRWPRRRRSPARPRRRRWPVRPLQRRPPAVRRSVARPLRRGTAAVRRAAPPPRSPERADPADRIRRRGTTATGSPGRRPPPPGVPAVHRRPRQAAGRTRAPSGPGGSAHRPTHRRPVTPPPKQPPRRCSSASVAAVVAALIIGVHRRPRRRWRRQDSTSTTESTATTSTTTRDSAADDADADRPRRRDRDHDRRRRRHRAPRPTDATTTTATASVTQVGKTVYFAGFQIDIATATFTPSENEFDDGKLVLDGIGHEPHRRHARTSGSSRITAPVTLHGRRVQQPAVASSATTSRPAARASSR